MTARPLPLMGKFRFGWAVFWAALVTLVFSTAIGMNDSIRNFPLEWMTAFGILAVIAGWILGRFERKKLAWVLFGLLSGFFILVLINSGGELNLRQAFLEGLTSIRPGLPFQPDPNQLQRMAISLYRLVDDLVDFYFRSLAWADSLLHKRTPFDPIINRTLWGSLFWCTSLLTGWLLRRRKHAFIASLPLLGMLAVILGYTRQTTTGLVTALFALLVMTALFEHLKLENQWQRNKIDFAEEIRFDMVSLGIPTIAVIMIVAGFLPNIPFKEIRKTLNQTFFSHQTGQSQLEDTLGLRVTPQTAPRNQNSGSLPRGFMIGTGPELSENLVMEIDTGEVFLPPEAGQFATLPKYYWFGRSYDIYTGTGWSTSEFSQNQHPGNETIVPADLTFSRLLTQTIRKSTDAPATVYSTGVPQAVDRRINLAWREATGEYYTSQVESRVYQVDSPVLEVPIQNLQQADQQAPEAIFENYLQMHQGTPQQVLNLAASITREALSPYDKAKAIETYLRQFEYTLAIPAPPDDRDLVDYFLFDLQKGYCDYYASAMVVLARAVGLPARLAVGYATGGYDHQRQLFVVTEADAHAWPEIYIAPFGWIPFEPTASEGIFNWTTFSDTPGDTENLSLTEPEAAIAKPYWPDLLILIGTIVLFICLLFFGSKRIRQNTRQAPTDLQITKIHQKAKKQLNNLFFAPTTAKTPLEFQNETIHWLNHKKASRLDTWLADRIIGKLQTLTGLYHQGVYAPGALTQGQIKSARRDLDHLLWQARILSLVFTISGR